MSNKIILCVEDNMQVQLFNQPLLEAKGFTVKLAMTIAEAKELIGRETPELIILDIHLPDGNGLDFLRELRKTSTVPVIALTNDDKEKDIVLGLESGCDDYVSKPYTFPVLYARIEALLRRAASTDTVTKGSLTLDKLSNRAMLTGKDLLLSPKEFALLLTLIQNEGITMGAEQLYQKVWKADMAGYKKTLQRHMSALRNKLEEEDFDYTIRNIYGEGYCFEKK